MFCPNCGNVSPTNQSFCRSCGMELGVVSEELSKLYDSPNEKSNYFNKVGIISVGMIVGAFITFFLVLLIRSGLHIGDNAAFVFFMFLSMFLWSFISILLIEKYIPRKKKPQNEEKKEYLSPKQVELWKSDRQLNESNFESIPSITESTTELIKIKRPKLKISGELG